MPKCSVISCPNNSRYMQKKHGVSYFSFPRNPLRCSEWAVKIGKARNDLNYKPFKGSVVCSIHFPASDIYTTTKGFSRLNKNAKPILHLSEKQIISNNNRGSTHIKPDDDNNQQTIERNEDSIRMSFDINDELRKSKEIRKIFMKRKLNLYDKIIQKKDLQINRLKKQNKRLIEKNTILKNTLKKCMHQLIN